MTELVLLYRWTLPAGAVFAVALAWLGAQLAARDRAMQTVCVNQGAMLGVLLAMGLEGGLAHDDPQSHVLPFALSFALSAATFAGTDQLARGRGVSKNTLFAAVFAVLLATGHFVSALFPALETHLSQVYFGDLATLTETDAQLTLAFGMAAAAALHLGRRRFAHRSFEHTLFGAWAGRDRTDAAFLALAIVLLCFGVQFLGFLFTTAMLFLPTVIAGYGGRRGLAPHLRRTALVALGGALGGFLLSLRFTRLPTVPAVTLTTFALASVGAAIDRLRADD